MVISSNSQRLIYNAAMRIYAESGPAQVNIKDLAQAAGVARGTVYNNVPDTSILFTDIVSDLALEMNERVIQSFGDCANPAVRLAIGMRLYVRRAHDEPLWGRFLVRYGFSDTGLQHLWNGQPLADLEAGIACGCYRIEVEQLASAVSLVAGATMGAIYTVLDGMKTWREAGSNAAEFTLSGLGVERDEARRIASSELPDLAELSDGDK